MMALPLWFAAVAFTFLVIYLVYSCVYAPFQVLQRCGFKGPRPQLFYGNYKDIKKLGWLKYYQHLYDTYGPVCGFYVGRRPSVLVADLEMVTQIMVKQFDNFTDRQHYPDLRRKKGSPRGLLSLQGEKWREARHILSPTFSPMKMKMMAPLVERSCNSLVERLGEWVDSDKSVDVFRVYGSFTMEAILATAFGRVVNLQKGEGDELTEAAAAIFSFTRQGMGMTGVFILLVISNFPFLMPLLRRYVRKSKSQSAFETLENVSAALVEARQQSGDPSRFKDLLQLMIDASPKEGEGEKDGGRDGEGGRVKGRSLTNKEIVANSLAFLLAGYETTANMLAYTSYLLARHPDVQERLQDEIDEYFTGESEVSMYEAAQKLEYLDMVIQESLRLYPPAPRTSRQCTKTTEVNGYTFLKDTVVYIPIHLFHHSPEYWAEPEKFNPDRFTAEEKAKRPSLCHMPFSTGPRNCIGMRFALMEGKMALIALLRKYKFVQAPDTEVPLETVLGITMTPKNGIYLRIASRD